MQGFPTGEFVVPINSIDGLIVGLLIISINPTCGSMVGELAILIMLVDGLAVGGLVVPIIPFRRLATFVALIEALSIDMIASTIKALSNGVVMFSNSIKAF